MKRFIGFILFALCLAVFFTNLGTNDIWTPNESLYADAARRMLESGNYLDFYFNGEIRLNKPPVTYWVVALSMKVFGAEEWALRLPIVLMALGTVVLIYDIGRRLYGMKEAIWTVISMVLSLQFIMLSRFASPEIPLLFFFTLTMFFFVKTQTESSRSSWIGFWISLGLTVLTKGYPYYLVIGVIVEFYLWRKEKFRLRSILKIMKESRIWWGLPLALIVGTWWVAYSYAKFGDQFFEILDHETTKRAFRWRDYSLRDLFFYAEISFWSFFPYSLVLFLGVYKVFRDRAFRQKTCFGWIWLGGMFVIFTIAKGKLPAYFLQAHPAMALIVGPLLAREDNVPRWLFGVPSILLVVVIGVLTVVLEFSWWYLILSLGLLMFVLLLKQKWHILGFKEEGMEELDFSLVERMMPFLQMLVFVMLFSWSLTPELERFRPYDEWGKLVEKAVIPSDVPLLVEGRHFYNQPYYLKRIVKENTPLEVIREGAERGPVLAVVSEKSRFCFPEAQTLWEGLLYKKESESIFFRFLMGHIKARNGDFSKFEKYFLIYQREPFN